MSESIVAVFCMGWLAGVVTTILMILLLKLWKGE